MYWAPDHAEEGQESYLINNTCVLRAEEIGYNCELWLCEALHSAAIEISQEKGLDLGFDLIWFDLISVIKKIKNFQVWLGGIQTAASPFVEKDKLNSWHSTTLY